MTSEQRPTQPANLPAENEQTAATPDDVEGHLLPAIQIGQSLSLGTQTQGIVSPRDPASGQATGKRSHQP